MHAPSFLRVNGPVSNLPEFWSAFAVKPEERMYRQETEPRTNLVEFFEAAGFRSEPVAVRKISFARVIPSVRKVSLLSRKSVRHSSRVCLCSPAGDTVIGIINLSLCGFNGIRN